MCGREHGRTGATCSRSESKRRTSLRVGLTPEMGKQRDGEDLGSWWNEKPKACPTFGLPVIPAKKRLYCLSPFEWIFCYLQPQGSKTDIPASLDFLSCLSCLICGPWLPQGPLIHTYLLPIPLITICLDVECKFAPSSQYHMNASLAYWLHDLHLWPADLSLSASKHLEFLTYLDEQLPLQC